MSKQSGQLLEAPTQVFDLSDAILAAGGLPAEPKWAKSAWMRGAGWRRWVLLVAAVIVVASSIYLDQAAAGGIVVLFVIVVPMEKLFPRHKGQKFRRPGLLTDIAYALFAPLSGVIASVVTVPLAIVTFAWLPGLALRPLVSLLPPLAKLVVGALLFDLTIYWVHRWSHEVPLLWRFHQIHHSTPSLDWISGSRSHPFDGALASFPLVVLLFAGFDLEFVGAIAVIQIVLGIFLHANVRWRLRPLWRFVITPEFHHWHHTNRPESMFTNYSITLPCWDIFFGTYRMPIDERPGDYGTDEPMPDKFIAQLALPLRGLPSPLRFIRHPWQSARAFYREVWALVIAIRLASRPLGTRKPT